MKTEFDFAKLLSKETIKINDVEIPKWGSLTPWELDEIQKLENANIYEYYGSIASIILCSRFATTNVSWNLIPMAISREIYEFAMNEFYEWKQPEEDSEKKQQTGLNSTSDSDLNTQAPSFGDAQYTSSESL